MSCEEIFRIRFAASPVALGFFPSHFTVLVVASYDVSAAGGEGDVDNVIFTPCVLLNPCPRCVILYPSSELCMSAKISFHWGPLPNRSVHRSLIAFWATGSCSNSDTSLITTLHDGVMGPPPTPTGAMPTHQVE